jgi:hypothetical protein
MYFRKKTSGGRAYLQIVESRREGAAVRQQVIATVGRLDELRQSGQLERLLRSGARFADKAIVLDAVAAGEAIPSEARRIGPALAFERLWQETPSSPRSDSTNHFRNVVPRRFSSADSCL